MPDSKYDALKISNQVCFPLYAASREMIKLYKPYLDEINLTYTQYITMMIMWEKQSVTVKELGQQLYLDSGTLTPLLKKLESKGLIERARSEKDERNLIVTITEAGEKLKETAVEIPYKMVNCTPLDEDDARELYKLLYKMLGNLSD